MTTTDPSLLLLSSTGPLTLGLNCGGLRRTIAILSKGVFVSEWDSRLVEYTPPGISSVRSCLSPNNKGVLLFLVCSSEDRYRLS